MQSNYKPIGNYIRLVDERNKGLKVKALLGLSISKQFIKSVANIIGTDMENYKIIRKSQFACSTMQVRRDRKMPVALYTEDEPAIISQAYPIFEIIDTDELLPEYLMMWFTRSEFDREACFHAVGGVRGSLEWEDFCGMKLPIPSPEKQLEIVREYNVIQNRIALNNQLIAKLEETAQAIYKQWFVEFEFPDENGKPYKSNGGEMEFYEELEKEIPVGWKFGDLKDVIEIIISHRGKSKSVLDSKVKCQEYRNPVISAMNVNGGKIVKHNTISYVNNLEYNVWMVNKLRVNDVIMTSEAPMGELLIVRKRKNYLLSQRLFALRVDTTKTNGVFLYFWLNSPIAKMDMEGRATGTTVQGLKLSELYKLSILCPTIKTLDSFEKSVSKILDLIELKNLENENINDLINLLLAKMTKVETENVII